MSEVYASAAQAVGVDPKDFEQAANAEREAMRSKAGSVSLGDVVSLGAPAKARRIMGAQRKASEAYERNPSVSARDYFHHFMGRNRPMAAAALQNDPQDSERVQRRVHNEIDSAQAEGVRKTAERGTEDIMDKVTERLAALEQKLDGVSLGTQVSPLTKPTNAGEWIVNVLRGEPQAALTGSGDGSGLMPELVTDEIWYSLNNLVALTRAGARVVRLPNGSYKVPAETTAATAYWLSENSAITDAASVFGDSSVEAHSIKALLSVSNEMLEDQPVYSQQAVMRSLTDALYRAMESAFLTGSGSNPQPEGIFTSTDVTSTDLSSTTLSIDAILDAYYDVLGKGANPANMCMILHPQAAAFLEKIRENDGQTSEGGYLAGTAAPLFRDLRWIVTDRAPFTDAATDTASVMIGDFQQGVTLYEFGQWRMNVDTSAAFANDSTMFRTVARMDVGIRHPELLHKLADAELG